MFFKKKTVEDILSEIEKLDEAARARLLETLSGGADESVEAEPQEQPETEPQTGETEEVGQTDEPTTESPAEGGQTPETELEESAATSESELPEETETATAENTATEDMTVPEEPPAAEPSAEPAQPEPLPAEDKSKELLEAQTARIDALESQLSAMKELLDSIATNQDNQNFGMSPQADFSDDARSLRTSAVLQGYAGRRANDYK